MGQPKTHFKKMIVKYSLLVLVSWQQLHAIPTQKIKQCARRKCGGMCIGSRVWYKSNCLSCFTAKCINKDTTSHDNKQAQCFNDICQRRCALNMAMCKRCMT